MKFNKKYEGYIEETTKLNLPDVKQSYDYDCGAKAVQAVLSYYSIKTKESDLIDQLGTNEKNGTDISSIKKVLKTYDLDVEMGQLSIEKLKESLDKNYPVIILLQSYPTKETKKDWKNTNKNGHYVIAIGYDDDTFTFEDPWVYKRVKISNENLLARWHDLNYGEIYKQYGVIIKKAKK